VPQHVGMWSEEALARRKQVAAPLLEKLERVSRACDGENRRGDPDVLGFRLPSEWRGDGAVPMTPSRRSAPEDRAANLDGVIKDRSADVPKKTMRAYCAIHRRGRCRVGRFLLQFGSKASTDGRLPRPEPSKWAAFVIGHDGSRSPRFPISWPETGARRTMRKPGRPGGSYRWLGQAKRIVQKKKQLP
jgi:hypothetical protein